MHSQKARQARPQSTWSAVICVKRWNFVWYNLNLCFWSRARPSAGDNRNEHWSLGHAPSEHITSAPNGLHGNHLYASISSYAVDQPLALTKSSQDIVVGPRERSVISGAVERQQVRPHSWKVRTHLMSTGTRMKALNFKWDIVTNI